jgi:hypothetical protein
VAMNNPACRFMAFFHNQQKKNGLERHEPDTNPRSDTRHEPPKSRECVPMLSLAHIFWRMGQSASRCHRARVGARLRARRCRFGKVRFTTGRTSVLQSAAPNKPHLTTCEMNVIRMVIRGCPRNVPEVSRCGVGAE